MEGPVGRADPMKGQHIFPGGRAATSVASLRGGVYLSSSKPSRMPVDCPTSMRWPSGSRM